MDMFRFRGKALGDLGTNANFMVPTNLVHIVDGPGRGTWDRKKTKKKTMNIRNVQHPSKFWDGRTVFSKMYKDQDDRIGKIYRFKKLLDRF